jgi:hypothetical protein
MVLLLVLFLLAGPLGELAAYVGPLDLVMPGLPGPTDVIKVLDLLTKSDSSTSVDVKMGDTTNQGKLLVARTRFDVAMERSSRNWRGRVVVRMSVPSDVSYSVDLASIKPEHIRLDAARRRLHIAMPQPRVEDVTPLLQSIKIDNAFNRARFRRLDTDVSQELQNAMLREDYQAKARQSAEARLPQVREQGKGVLQEFLQKLLGGTFQGIAVVVE